MNFSKASFYSKNSEAIYITLKLHSNTPSYVRYMPRTLAEEG
jgi:hypothetical protein